MKVKSSLHRYLAIIAGGGWKSLVSVFTLGLFSVSGAFGATYTLVNLGTASSPVEFSERSNWTVNGESATALPGTDDTIDWDGGAWVYPHIALDGDYTVGSLTRSYARPAWYKSGNAAGDVVTITFATQLGGSAYQEYTVNQGTKMVIAEGATLRGATSDSTTSTATVQNGGEIDVLGAVSSRHIKWVAKTGGTLYFAPTSYRQTSDTTYINDVFDIANAASSIVFPNGLTVTGGNSSWRNEFKHNYGTVTFGGAFTSNSPWTYEWKAGVIAATADVTFGDTISLTIPDPSPNARNITVDAVAGASFTFPASTYFGTTVNLTKTGEGDVRFAGSTLPTMTAVSAGGFALCKNDATYDLSAVTFAAGTKLKIAASGITLSATDASIANATFAALDGYIPASGATVLTCADSSVLAQAQAGLNASLASVGISVEIDGNSLVAESHYTFNSSTVSDMNDATGWVNNLAAPAGQPVIIAGSQTAAVMDGAVPAYSAIAVTDGATLKVAATRDLPATTLAAGTVLRAAASGSVPATVTATGDFATTGSGSVTIDVAADCVLDLSGVDVTTEATLIKTGDGTILFGDELPSGLDVQAGVLAVQPYVEYDMTDVTLGQGATVAVAIDGTFKPAVSKAAQSGKTIYMTGDTYIGAGGWDTLANWTSGALPDASAVVHIYGGETVLTLDAVPAVMPASISVEGGATLRVLADITLPPLAIDATSKVVFGDNETRPKVAATLDAALTTVCDATATPVALPVFEISTNATVTIAGGMKFKNVDFRLYGTVAKESMAVPGPIFGYAASGETSYIAFVSDGGIFDIHAETSGDPDLGKINFLCPESGGKVVAVGTIVLRNSTHNIKGWNDMGDVRFGYRNPMTEGFDVLVDNTKFNISGNFYASGAAHLALVNGSYIRRDGNCLGHGFNMVVGDAATVDVGEACYIDFVTGAGNFAIDSQSAVDAITVHDGGIYNVTYTSSGWGRGVFASDGGVLGVSMLYDTRVRSDLLRGFGAVRLDGDLAIESLAVRSGDHYKTSDRYAKMANIPFTGTGDVVVTNGVPADPFTVTMVNGANTATGSIKVDKVEGDAETALFFADGANWAGTVVAGNVALTNLTDGAATATFGTLDLAADFNIRVWIENGVVVTNDMVNVGEYQSHGGRLSIEPMTEGLEFAAGDKIVVGKIAKASPNPAVKAGWCVKRLAIDGDDANEILVAKKGIGLQVILK